HHREGVGPVHGADPGRLDDLRRRGRGVAVCGCNAGHGGSLSNSVTALIRRNYTVRYCTRAMKSMQTAHRLHKNASRSRPRLANRVSPWERSGHADQDAGISTVSTTWMTPFDWCTLEIDTIDLSPLASMIQILPSACLTVSSSPSTVFSILPS